MYQAASHENVISSHHPLHQRRNPTAALRDTAATYHGERQVYGWPSIPVTGQICRNVTCVRRRSATPLWSAFKLLRGRGSTLETCMPTF